MRGFKSKGRTTLRSILFAAATLSVSACFSKQAYQLEDWQKNPKACAEFWDNYFPKALSGDDAAAASLFFAIIRRNLVPPGRSVYSQEQKDFDLLALQRLSIHKYQRPTGDTTASPYSEAVWQGYDPLEDPHSVLARKDREIYLYTVSADYRGPSVCSLRTGLDNNTKAWASACRKILADDGVLPSSEQLLATIPKQAKACGYRGE